MDYWGWDALLDDQTYLVFDGYRLLNNPIHDFGGLDVQWVGLGEHPEVSAQVLLNDFLDLEDFWH